MNILSNFPKRLAELMQDNNLTALDLANQLNINRTTITRYLNGARLPSYATLIKFINFFNCSADYFLGIVDTDYSTHYLTVPPFCERLKKLMTDNHLTQYKLHNLTNFSFDNFNMWLSGKTQPYPDNLVKLAKAFNCSIDYLIGHSE